MSEDECMVAIIRSAMLMFIAFVTLLVGSCQMTKYRIVQAIEAGASPLAAECALTADVSCPVITAAEAERIRNDPTQ